MDSIIEKLAKIEETAQAIVENAENQKFEVEKEIQEKRDEFDSQIDREIAEKVEIIRAEGKKKMDTLLDEEQKKHRTAIKNLEAEFKEHHTEYARNIVKNILEV